jgi:ligand-binding sensor domain-containing protein
VLGILTMISNSGKLRRRLALGSAAFLILLGCPFIVCLSLAQYHAEVRTVDDGLPQNTVSAILQTRDGYLWLATNGGLARYARRPLQNL